MVLFVLVVFLENEIMYGKTFELSDEVLDPEYLIPLGKAKVERQGLYLRMKLRDIYSQ